MKPLLVGMNNPVAPGRAGFELYPYPPGCTGHRLLELLRSRVPGVRRREYLQRFERRNLVQSATWSAIQARTAAGGIMRELEDTGRTVVLFGAEVRAAFGMVPLLVYPQQHRGCTWRQLPHPSGRNLWYNDPRHRMVAALLLEELYCEQ